VCCCEGIGKGGVDEDVQSRFMSTRPKFRTADGRVHRAMLESGARVIVNLPSKKASFSVSIAAGMGLLLIGASGASADSFTVTGSDSDGPVSVDLGAFKALANTGQIHV